MRKQKTMVVVERNVVGQRTYEIKSLTNSVDYSIGESLDIKTVNRLMGVGSWTVKVVSDK